MIDLDNMKLNKPEIAAALRAIESAEGKITPRAVYEAGKSTDSPLHDLFIWDPAKAVDTVNLAIARQIIATVKYKIVTVSHGTVRAPVYVRDPDATQREQGYVALRTVVQKGPDAFEIVAREIETAQSHIARALAVGIALGLGDELNRLIDTINAVKQIVTEAAEKRAA